MTKKNEPKPPPPSDYYCAECDSSAAGAMQLIKHRETCSKFGKPAQEFKVPKGKYKLNGGGVERDATPEECKALDSAQLSKAARGLLIADLIGMHSVEEDEPATPLTRAEARVIYEMLLDFKAELKNLFQRTEREIERFARYREL